MKKLEYLLCMAKSYGLTARDYQIVKDAYGILNTNEIETALKKFIQDKKQAAKTNYAETPF